MLNIRRACVALSFILPAVTSQALALSYPDVAPGQWFSKYIEFLSGQNVVSGYPNNQFRPHNDVTRAEFASMLAKSQGQAPASGSATQFRDVPATHWASGAVSLAASRGWISGYPDGTFGPSRPITHAEMYTIVSKLIPGAQPSNVSAILSSFSDGSSVPTWAEAAVAKAVSHGVFVTEVTPNQIEPFNHASRADVATTVAKLVNQSFRTEVAITDTPQPTTQRVISKGVLIHETDGDWVIRGSSGEYLIDDSYDMHSFQPGMSVDFEGLPIPGGTPQRPIIRIVNIHPVVVPNQPPRRETITLRGQLRQRPATGDWILRGNSTGDTYVLNNISVYQNESWFKDGTAVRVEGRVNRDRPGGGRTLRLNVLTMRPQGGPQQGQVTIRGQLSPTVEAGGWTITDRQSATKYLLLNIEQYRNRPWFVSGARLTATGSISTDAVTVHMEGTPFRVTSLAPTRPN